jgi:hypothetical protein
VVTALPVSTTSAQPRRQIQVNRANVIVTRSREEKCRDLSDESIQLAARNQAYDWQKRLQNIYYETAERTAQHREAFFVHFPSAISRSAILGQRGRQVDGA